HFLHLFPFLFLSPSFISPPISSRLTNFVLIGSLCAARRSASRAVSSSTPATSNKILPGLTTATHPSRAPLPEPIRTSKGFAVYGLSGKILIQTFPPRFI